MQITEGRGRGYFSSEYTPPDNSILFELVVNNAVYVGGAYGLKKLSEYKLGKENGYTGFDLLQKQLRNTLDKLPFTFGALNTFRIPEFMSPYLSTKAMGLEETYSVMKGQENKRVGSYVFEKPWFENKETQTVLRNILGDEGYAKIQKHMSIPALDYNYNLIYEQDLDKTGRGNLFLQVLDENGTVKNRELISDSVALFYKGYSADTYDILTSADVQQKINPAYVGVLQSLDIPAQLPEKEGALNKIFASVNPYTGQVESSSKFGLIPSIEGPMKSLSDVQRRLAYPTSYFNFGFNRFNRLLSATAEQVPVIGDSIGKIADTMGLSLRTTPGPVYKQFFQLGFKATKIAAAYMALDTVDHYRRKFDTPGHLIISAGVAYGASKLYEKSFDAATRRFKPLQVGIAAFGAQLLPGFSEGIIPGLATMATSLDVLKSYVGLGTGMSFYRRGIEGLLPGISDPSIGIGFGIGLAIASYANVGRNRLIKGSKEFMPDWFTNRYGFMDVKDTEGGILNIKKDLDKVYIGSDYKEERASFLRKTFFDFSSQEFRDYNPLFGKYNLDTLSETKKLEEELVRTIDTQQRLTKEKTLKYQQNNTLLNMITSAEASTLDDSKKNFIKLTYGIDVDTTPDFIDKLKNIYSQNIGDNLVFAKIVSDSNSLINLPVQKTTVDAFKESFVENLSKQRTIDINGFVFKQTDIADVLFNQENNKFYSLSMSDIPNGIFFELEDEHLLGKLLTESEVTDKNHFLFKVLTKQGIDTSKISTISSPEVGVMIENKGFYNKVEDINKRINQYQENILKSDLFKKYQEVLGKKFGSIENIDIKNKDHQKILNRLFNFVKEELGNDLNFLENRVSDLDFENKIDTVIKTKMYDKEKTQNFLNYSLINRIEDIQNKYKNSQNPFAPLFKRIEMFASETYHAFHGASMAGDAFDTAARDIGYKPWLRRAGTLFAAGFLLHSAIFGSLLGSMENPSELREIYSGKQTVEIKKGRFWEGGGTPYEGTTVNYTRPHAYHLLMTRAEEKSVWGDEDELYNPITKFFLKNFTYHLEEKHYYDRPYPITGTAFENVPIIGTLLSHTIGRLIKPPKIMHADEYMRINDTTGDLEYYYPPEVGTTREAGETSVPGLPISPYSNKLLLGKVQYQVRELEGLTGWVKNMIQKASTGREVYGTDYTVMSSANQMDSSVHQFWDKDLGGMMFMSEALRRVFPRPRKEIQQYNPINNAMPHWMPEKFKRGDPYTKIQSGYARLPGEGYAAVYPELQGIDVEDYPDIFKFKILADVDPTSREVVKLRNQLYERRAAGITSDYENEMMDQVSEDLAKVLSMEEFRGHHNQIKIPIASDLTRAGYDTFKEGLRTVAQPVEHLIPFGFRPTMKLLGGERSAIDQYEHERLYSTSMAFWDEPYRDWLRPAAYSALNMMGWEGKPLHVKDREEVASKFDRLNFYKFMALADTAPTPFDKKKMMAQAAKTRYGVNPTGDPLSIYMALPDEEKKFFNEFAYAQGSDRDRILEMIPEDQVHLYQGLWTMLDQGGDPSAYIGEKPQYDEAYLQQQYDNLDLTDMSVPEPDWVGWNKDVDINDIKVNYVSSLGADMRDYDLWESQAKRTRRHNALSDAHLFMYENPIMERGGFTSSMKYANPYARNIGLNLSVNTTTDYRNYAKIVYNDNRQQEIEALMQPYFNGY